MQSTSNPKAQELGRLLCRQREVVWDHALLELLELEELKGVIVNDPRRQRGEVELRGVEVVLVAVVASDLSRTHLARESIAVLCERPASKAVWV